jgi:hypothetical protein
MLSDQEGAGADAAGDAAGAGLGKVSGPFWPQPMVSAMTATAIPAAAGRRQRVATLEGDCCIRSS